MVQQHNPWVTKTPASPTSPSPRSAHEAPPGEHDPGSAGPQPEEPVEPASVTGPTHPQAGIVVPEDGLPVRPTTGSASLFIVGAHGGAGESTVAGLDPRWLATDHTWPEVPDGSTAHCVVVARTHVPGLLAAQRALTQWAASGAGPSARCAGLLLIADAPGRLPSPILDMVKHVSGGAPRLWRLDWIEQWRLGDLESRPPRAARRLLRELHTLPAATAAGIHPNEGE